MTVERQNFDLRAGDSKSVEFHVVDSAGADVDITNYSVYWKAVDHPIYKNVAIATKSVGSGITKNDPTHGKFTVSITKSDSLNLRGLYYHEAKIVTASLDEYTNTTGRMIVHDSAV